jgi:two-component SAPR family response regulator
MNILIVDDERLPLENLTRTVKSVCSDASITGFMKPGDALKYAHYLDEAGMSPVDLAFLDIEMVGMNGLELAKKLKELNGKVNVVFATGHSEYALDAHAMYASGYLMKPVSENAVIEVMDNLRHPGNLSLKDRIRVQTFGNFEIYADDKPLNFSRSKTKELLAYLVLRRGARCSNNELAAVIWESKVDSASLQSQFRHLVFDLKNTLQSVNAEDILVRQRGYIAIVPGNITCDMYDFIDSDAGTLKNYTGEFMSQYSWAESTNAYFEKMI